MTTHIKPPVTFWIAGVIALLWNLMGIFNFITSTFFVSDMYEAMSAEQQQMVLENPLWMKIVFGVATVAGLLGSIGLLMRKRWCVPVLLLSLIAVVIQMGYSSLFTDALEVFDQSPIFPAIVVIFSLVLWYYAHRSDGRGYLK